MLHSEEQEDKDDYEEVEDEEFIDEDFEENGERRSRVGFGPTGKTVTLQMLLSAEILTPGEGTMAIEYLGQRFIGDLLPDGKIKSQETDIIFASPSAWAIHCKRIINPEKKSGCGWASVKYRGRKLDAYKNIWFKKKSLERNKENEGEDGLDEDMEKEKMIPPAPIQQRLVLKHHALASRSITHDPNILVESTPFSSMGKIQPFLVSMATNAVLVMDFHCHLTTSEVVGYLAGHWDVNAHNLAITHAFPCRSRLADRELAPMVEADIYRAIEQRHLTLVGWYHSHPFAAATPTLRDIDAQLDYQIKMKGNSDASYTPCVGVICSPYNPDSTTLESAIVSYWVMPPPESKPHEYGKSMLMSYSVVQDQFLSQDSLNEMKRCVDFYKKGSDFIKFSEKYKGSVTYLEKLKNTLTSKFPRDQSDGVLWGFIRDLVSQENDLPEIPNTVITSSSCQDRVNLLVPNIPMPSSKTNSNNLMSSSDIANALFATGKFPSPSSLMGLASDSITSSNLTNLVRSNMSLTSGSLAGMGLRDTSHSSNSLRDMALSSNQLSNMFLSPLSFNMDSMSILSSMAAVNPVPSTSKASDLTLSSKDSINFNSPDSKDKNCVASSGKI